MTAILLLLGAALLALFLILWIGWRLVVAMVHLVLLPFWILGRRR